MFYSRFISLCEAKGVAPGTAVQEIGLSRASVSKWKAGAIPGGANLQKLADYFGVTVNSLLQQEEQTEQDPLIAFYGTVKHELDEEDMQDLMTYMRMKAEIKRNRRNDQG